MVATLQSRKEALQAKIKEKNEELKKLCIQEAELTGVIPPEIPLEPGESPPQLRRRVGTSFSFPQNLINSLKNADDESLTALELECKVQTNIAEAALTLANDSAANKAVRKKHRLMYRQSQRRLMELETRLTLLKQGKSQGIKQQHAKKKPRPLMTSNEQIPSSLNSENQVWNNYNTHDSWPFKEMPASGVDEVDNVHHDFNMFNNRFGSLHRSRRSSATSRSSGSSRIEGSIEEMQSLTHNNSTNNQLLASSQSQPNIQGITMDDILKMSEMSNTHRRPSRRGTLSGHWDTMSAGGTLLPNQTYPEHSHHPNLSRTQSLGSVETNIQRTNRDSWCTQEIKDREPSKEKEWYETSLDSAPSPPLRTSSRLPPAARLLYNLREAQIRGATRSPHSGNKAHNTLARTNNISTGEHDAYNNNLMQQSLSKEMYQLTNTLQMQMQDLGISETDKKHFLTKENNFVYGSDVEHRKVAVRNQSQDLSARTDMAEMKHPSNQKPMLVPGIRENKDSARNHGFIPSNLRSQEREYLQYGQNISTCESVIINIPEDYNENSFHYSRITEASTENPQSPEVSSGRQEHSIQGNRTPTQPYYHVSAFQPNSQIRNPNESFSSSDHTYSDRTHDTSNDQDITSPSVHPPHAVTQSEVVFDTVVPFESPQNHMVIQAGKWQPYREVTKPFEMSDFYKYSTKFRQSKTPVPGSFRSPTPVEPSRQTPNLVTATHHKGIYQPLQPMTCQAVDYKQLTHLKGQINPYLSEQTAEISQPELV